MLKLKTTGNPPEPIPLLLSTLLPDAEGIVEVVKKAKPEGAEIIVPADRETAEALIGRKINLRTQRVEHWRGLEIPIMHGCACDAVEQTDEGTPLVAATPHGSVFLIDLWTVLKAVSGYANPFKHLRYPYADVVRAIFLRFLKSGDFWPGGRRFAVALTHDLERVVPLPHNPFEKVRRRIGYPSRTIHLDQLNPFLSTEANHGYHSTFFFLSPTTWFDSDLSFHHPRTKALINRVLEAGCEIGLHGSFFSYTDPLLLSDERKALEDAAGRQVRGIRQHFLHFEYPGTWHAQADAGFKYDCTACYNDVLGFRTACARPYMPIDLLEGKEIGILEIPTPIMDVVLFRPEPWMALKLEEAERTILKTLEIVEKVSGGVALLFHTEYYSDERYTDLYEAVLAHLSKRDAWVTTGKEVAAWCVRRS